MSMELLEVLEVLDLLASGCFSTDIREGSDVSMCDLREKNWNAAFRYIQ